MTRRVEASCSRWYRQTRPDMAQPWTNRSAGPVPASAKSSRTASSVINSGTGFYHPEGFSHLGDRRNCLPQLFPGVGRHESAAEAAGAGRDRGGTDPLDKDPPFQEETGK